MFELNAGKLLSKAFYRYGKFVAKRPVPFVVLPLLLGFGLGTGLYLQKKRVILDAEYMYIPQNARSFYEKTALHDHWPTDPEWFIPGRSYDLNRWVQVILKPEISGSLLQLDMISEIKSFNDRLVNTMKVPVDNGSINRYADVCMQWAGECSFTNEHVSVLEYLFERQDQIKLNETLTYPRLNLGISVPMYIANVLGGVKTKPDRDVIFSADAILLLYFLRADTPLLSEYSAAWGYAVAKTIEEYLMNNKSSQPQLSIAYYHSNSLVDGLSENDRVVIPKFAFSFGAIFFFTMLNTLKFHEGSGPWLEVDWVRSKLLLGFCGIVAAGIGMVSAEGLLLYCGQTKVMLVSVMPFLILAIGVDDTFVMLAAWHRTGIHESVAERVAHTLAETATSITITSVTSALSFAVGISSSIRAIRIFCIFTSLGICLNCVAQLTFFTGAMALLGRSEKRGRNGAIPCIKHELKEKDNLSTRGRVDRFCREVYGPFLLKFRTKTVALLLLVAYISVAIYGATRLEEGLKPQNVVLRHHHIVKFYDYMEQYFWPKGLQAEIVVNNAPNLTMTQERAKIEEFVHEFETTQYSMGPAATDFWLREYLDYLNKSDIPVKEKPVQWSRNVREWLGFNFVIRKFSADLSFRNANTTETNVCDCDLVISAFRFRVGLQGLSSTQNQQLAVKALREIGTKYPEYNVTTYGPDWPYLDQYSVIRPTAQHNILIAIACMIAIAVIFFANFNCVFWITASIVSIDVGIIGFMALWGVKLDFISLVTIIMSIGMSVDYVAHITHGYTSSRMNTQEERAIDSLATLGVPILQGAGSTQLGVLVLAFVDSYMVNVFFKTVTLIIVFGMLHACVFLPVLLSCTDNMVNRVKDLVRKIMSNSRVGDKNQAEKSSGGSENGSNSSHSVVISVA